ncbi:MAG TPA: carbamate kinase [Tepidimicrobium sp.]|nr:carbamate kinase [Tepidimicrobium sp.]
MSRILIALGGNALGDNPREQMEIIGETSRHIADLIEGGHEVVIAHGNGPQVGMISVALEKEQMPLPECTAMSQGYIGYHLQNRMNMELNKRGIDKKVVSLITQVVVDKEDEAFNNPDKPIGRFYTKEEAEEVGRQKNYIMMKDSNRGYRRAVPSPKPIDIVEKESVKTLLDNGYTVIAVGGGGIPVAMKGDSMVGVDAVVDKDFAGELMAELIDADYLFILTAVDRVAINFGKPDQMDLERITVEEAYKYIEEGHFAPGSMLPKIRAAIDFVESKEGRRAIISSIEGVKGALEGKSGTLIYR